MNRALLSRNVLTEKEMNSTVQGAQSFARSIAVLQVIADHERPISRAQLAECMELTRPTLYRIIASLEAEGLISQAGQGTYQLGPRLISLARTALAQNDIRKLAEPLLEDLRDRTGETVHLAVPGGDAMVYIDKIESRQIVRMTSMIGTRIPFHSTAVGKAYLSALTMPEADALIDKTDLVQVTEFTVTDRDALKADISRAHEHGSVREDQENELGIVCFGAPVRDETGRCVAAISVSIPMFRMDETKLYGQAVGDAAIAISRILGYDANDPVRP